MPDERIQFRVLYRQFLANLIDLELLAAQGDVTKLLGQFAAILATLSGFMGFGALLFDTRHMDPRLAAESLTGAAHFLISTTMLVAGVFAVLSWDAAFPGRRDVLVLAPLPVRARTFFFAKAAALGAAVGVLVASLNVFSAPGWSLHFAHAEWWGLPRAFASLLIAEFAAGAFVFLLTLAVQGLAAQTLPRPIFLRVSAALQIAAFCVFVGVYFLEPPVSASEPSVRAFPSYWFLAAFQSLNGDAHFPLARQAWIGLAILALVAVCTYVLCYVRTMPQIVEQPDLAPAVGGLRWLPRFGNPLETAVTRFAARTISRSRQHHVVLAFYLGIGFAILILGLRTPAQQKDFSHAGIALLFASYIVLIATMIGMRAVFAMPLALRANWIFRVTESRPPLDYLAAIRRPLFVLGLAPVWIVWACVFFSIWPWRRAAEHLSILGLCGAIAGYACLFGFRKIPFTCSFLPGRSKMNMAILWAMGMLLGIGEAARIENGLLDRPAECAAVIFALAIAAATMRWFVTRSGDGEVQFEESEPPAVLTLGLSATR